MSAVRKNWNLPTSRMIYNLSLWIDHVEENCGTLIRFQASKKRKKEEKLIEFSCYPSKILAAHVRFISSFARTKERKRREGRRG